MESAVKTVLPREVRKLASAMEEKDGVLQDHDNQIQAIHHENVGLQCEIRAKDQQMRTYEDTITHLSQRYVDHAKDLGKDNIIIIVRKHIGPVNDKFRDFPYYVARIKQRKIYVKLRWFDQHFPDHEVVMEIDNPNSIYAFNRFEEEAHPERRHNHFRLIDLTRKESYAMGVPTILVDEEE